MLLNAADIIQPYLGKWFWRRRLYRITRRRGQRIRYVFGCFLALARLACCLCVTRRHLRIDVCPDGQSVLVTSIGTNPIAALRRRRHDHMYTCIHVCMKMYIHIHIYVYIYRYGYRYRYL